MIDERRRIAYALLLSLLIHTLLLSLTFRGQGLWLLWLAFPWQDRRIETPDLRVTLVGVPSTATEPAVTPVAEPSRQTRVEQPPASGQTLTPSASRAPAAVRLAPAVVSEANPSVEADPRTATAALPATAKASLLADQSRNTAPPAGPAPAVIALERIDEPAWVVPATPPMQPPVIIAAAPSASIAETVVPTLPDFGDAARARIDQEASERAAEQGKLKPSKSEEQQQTERIEAARAENARLETDRQEAAQQLAALQEAARKEVARQEVARQEAARQEATRQEAVRQEAARQEAARQEATRQEAVRQEAAWQEAARQEAARQEAAQQEAARQEAARQEAARQEAARQEAARQEAARQEAARQEAARQEVARQEVARQEAERQEAARVEAQEAEARREARLRAIGRQLDQEATQRQAATASTGTSRSSLPPPWSLRRYRLFGRTDPNEEIILYAEAWERKIQLNTTLDVVLEAAKQPHTNPVVKVAIRSDGSVESVTFVLSSGVPALDDAIRRIVDSQKPYRVFPPSLASEYDVIEIRRTWYFGAAIRFY